MAQKKITIELTNTEAAHVKAALESANELHTTSHDRENPALVRALAKLDEASTPVDRAGDKPAEEE